MRPRATARARVGRAPPGHARERPLRSARVDLHHVGEELERLRLRPLEGVAAHDRAERAALAESADLLEHGVGALRLAAGEDDDPLSVERRLDDVAHPLRQARARDLLILVDLLRLYELHEI